MELNVKRIEKLEELGGDLANRYHSTRSTGYEHILESEINADFERLKVDRLGLNKVGND